MSAVSYFPIADHISGPMLLEQYVAVADYKKQNGNEVNMVAGDIVEVIDKNENGTTKKIRMLFNISVGSIQGVTVLTMCLLSGNTICFSHYCGHPSQLSSDNLDINDSPVLSCLLTCLFVNLFDENFTYLIVLLFYFRLVVC